MAVFVLVHGSTQNGDGWARLGNLLTARGHVVTAPELPKHALNWGFREYAAEIAQSIAGPETVVVAHSLSGTFLPLVPQLRDCALLVFLAAVIPEPGRSARDQFADDPSMFSPEWIEAGARWLEKSQHEALAKKFLLHDCDDETLTWALSTIELLDTRHLFTQPHPLTIWPTVRAASIVATHDRTLSPNWIRKMSRRVLGTEPIEIQAGHCPHVSQPESVADILDQLVLGKPPDKRP